MEHHLCIKIGTQTNQYTIHGRDVLNLSMANGTTFLVTFQELSYVRKSKVMIKWKGVPGYYFNNAIQFNYAEAAYSLDFFLFCFVSIAIYLLSLFQYVKCFYYCLIAKLNSNFNFNFSLSFELSSALLSNFPTTHPPNRVSSEGDQDCI